MNKNIYEETYLGFINPPIVIATSLPFFSCFLLFHLLEMHGVLVWEFAGFCGILGSYYVNTKVNLKLGVNFVSFVIGFFLVLFLLQLIKFVTGVMIYGY